MSNCISTKEPPYAERHVRWCERSENESRKKTTSFSSYSIITIIFFIVWNFNINSHYIVLSGFFLKFQFYITLLSDSL